jgi:uncharacterized membrane protein YoaT (DUF817 family)
MAIRESSAPVIYLTVMAVAAITGIVYGAPDWAVSSFIVLSLVVHLVTGGLASRRQGAVAALLAMIAGPLAECICIRQGAWSYLDGGSIMGMPLYLFPLWASAGAFIVALYDAAYTLVLTLQPSAPCPQPSALCPQPQAGALWAWAAGSVLMLFATIAVVSAMALRLPPLVTALIALSATGVTAFTVVSVHGVLDARWDMVVAAFLVSAAVGVTFPLLEAICIKAGGAWSYEERVRIKSLDVPLFLFPVWALIAFMIPFVTVRFRTERVQD